MWISLVNYNIYINVNKTKKKNIRRIAIDILNELNKVFSV
jgi:hypothetical protein